jgi:hypothetical protein
MHIIPEIIPKPVVNWNRRSTIEAFFDFIFEPFRFKFTGFLSLLPPPKRIPNHRIGTAIQPALTLSVTNRSSAGASETFMSRLYVGEKNLSKLRPSKPQLLQRLIISALEPGEEIVLVEWKMLRQRNGHDPLLWINLAIRCGRAVPAELAH